MKTDVWRWTPEGEGPSVFQKSEVRFLGGARESAFRSWKRGGRMSERFWLLRFKIYVFEYLFDDWIFGNE